MKVLPILNSPRNPLSNGAGMLEYIFFSMAEGVFPFFLIAGGLFGGIKPKNSIAGQ